MFLSSIRMCIRDCACIKVWSTLSEKTLQEAGEHESRRGEEGSWVILKNEEFFHLEIIHEIHLL